MGRKLLNQAGIGFGGETDADPVGAGTDVDAGGVKMVHGQRFELGGLLLTQGFALGLGPGFATVIGLAVGAGLGLRAAGGRASWLASGSPGSRCRHGGTPSKEREDPYSEGTGGHALLPRGSVRGSRQGQVRVTNGNHAIAGSIRAD